MAKRDCSVPNNSHRSQKTSSPTKYSKSSLPLGYWCIFSFLNGIPSYYYWCPSYNFLLSRNGSIRLESPNLFCTIEALLLLTLSSWTGQKNWDIPYDTEPPIRPGLTVKSKHGTNTLPVVCGTFWMTLETICLHWHRNSLLLTILMSSIRLERHLMKSFSVQNLRPYVFE